MKYKKITVLIILGMFLFVCSLSTISAANQTITPSDTGGIRGAITNTSVNPGDTIYLQPGTYNKTGNDTNFTISKNITLQGNSSTNNVIIDAQGLSRIFTIGNGYNITFINIIFINANAAGYGGAIYNNYANTLMTVINCSFINNQITNSSSTTGLGGAIYTLGNNLTIINCIFNNNTAYRYGGAVQVQGVNSYIDNCTFTNNTAVGNSGAEGGALHFQRANSTVINCIFINNSATNGAGAIRNAGSIAITGGTNQSIINCTFINNTGTDGGAIYNQNGVNNQSIINCTFINNTGTNGGAIHDLGSFNVTINNCAFISNMATDDSGGAIFLRGRAVDAGTNKAFMIVNCTFTNNTASSNGGAIFSRALGYNIIVANSTFEGNNADNHGGAIFNNENMTVLGNTMNSNSANLGQMIYNSGSMGVLNLTYLSNSTVKTSKGSNVVIYAILTDDMGNTVTGQDVSFYVDGVFIANVTSIEGKANITYLVTQDPVSILPVTGDYSGHDGYSIVLKNGELLIPKIATNITIDVPKNIKVGQNTTLKSKLTDKDGKPIANATVDFYVDGKKVGSAITDENGIAKLNYTFTKAGNPTITAMYAGNDTYLASNASTKSTVSRIKTNLELETDNETITATLTDENGNPLTNKKITIKVNGKTFTGITDADGQVIIKFPNANKYRVTAKFAGDYQYAPSSATIPAESEPDEPTSDVLASGKVAMKSTGIPIMAALLVFIASIGLVLRKKSKSYQ